jgi:hypothetical protein
MLNNRGKANLFELVVAIRNIRKIIADAQQAQAPAG